MTGSERHEEERRAIPVRPLVAGILVLLASATACADDEEEARARRRTPVVEVFEMCRDAVVSISATQIVETRSSVFDDFFQSPFDLRGPRRYEVQSAGSGFVIHPDGYLVTNAHVVDRTVERKAVFADGREFEARIVASDARNDLAVLKVEADRPLPTLTLGRSDDLMVGETVIAIGNPLGYQHTVTSGVLSAVGRNLDLGDGAEMKGLVQTDASINPGNSGGPLLNILGELIGVNTAIRADAQNIGFAIPVDRLRDVLPEMLDVERRYSVVVGLGVEAGRRAVVTGVSDGSPAAVAGLAKGDVVRSIDGRALASGVDYHFALVGRRPGEVLRFEVERESRTLEAPVTLARRPAPDGAELARRKLGLTLAALPAGVARDLGLRRNDWLYVSEVETGGPAARLGLGRSDVLVSIDRHHVTTLEDLGQTLEAAVAGQSLRVTILRSQRGRWLEMWGDVTVR